MANKPAGRIGPYAERPRGGRHILTSVDGEDSAVRGVSILRVSDGSRERRDDRVSVEEPLEIRVGAETLAVTMRTPGHDFDLAAGWLLAEGIVRRPDEIVRMEHCREVRSPEEEGNVVLVRATAPAGATDRARRLLLTSSSCGLCGKGSIESLHGHFPRVPAGARLDPAVLGRLPDLLRASQGNFSQTGGLHAAGIFTLEGELLVCREDVGRHNAVDKAIGALFRQGATPLSRHLLLVSGRASFEIVQKALAAALPVLAAVSAPSSLAVDLARESGMTLVGFLRDGGFNVYSGEERLSPAGTARSAPG
jgi:FdhD protein